MALNVEIKAKVKHVEQFRARAEAISEKPAELIVQVDTFFHTGRGRLKLRVLAPDWGQLIYYERADQTGPKQSEYFISETAEPERLREVLARAMGTKGVVSKQRWLYRAGNTRIHLDEVEGLGWFMELEVVLRTGESAEEGQAIATALMSSLGVAQGDLIEGAYIDLLES